MERIKFFKDESGESAVEYGLLVTLIAGWRSLLGLGLWVSASGCLRTCYSCNCGVASLGPGGMALPPPGPNFL